jgi:AcrR family transcriptional regulator
MVKVDRCKTFDMRAEPSRHRRLLFVEMESEPPAAYSGDVSGAGPFTRPDVFSDVFSPRPPRQERSRRAREALLDAALSRFAANGYDATTVEEIARHAGIAVGGLYMHFRSKRQVLLVLVDRLLRELESVPRTARAGDAASIMDCIRWCFNARWRHAGVYRAWREATLRDSLLAAMHVRIEAWTRSFIAEALTAAAATPGARRDVDIPALSCMLNVIFLRLLEVRGPDRGVLSETIVAVVRHAVFADAGGAGRGVTRSE